MDIKLELVMVPVSDVDRAKAFYVDQVGFVPGHDPTISEDVRFIQDHRHTHQETVLLGR